MNMCSCKSQGQVVAIMHWKVKKMGDQEKQYVASYNKSML